MSKIYILKSEALIIFAKNPVAGKVKTRLAASIGDEASVAVYKKLLQHTKEVAKHSSCEKYLYVNENIAAFSEWPDSVFSKHTQVSGQLGHKMEMAFGEILNKHEKVIIIGSDSPDITSSIINEAFTKLDIADVVIGPSTDGGYYLLGIKELSTFLFRDINWSTATVLEDTIKAIQANNLLYTQLSPLTDIDEIADLEAFPSFKP